MCQKRGALFAINEATRAGLYKDLCLSWAIYRLIKDFEILPQSAENMVRVAMI